MSTITGLLHIKKAISTLNPDHVRHLANKPLRVGIRASSAESYAQIENFLLSGLAPARRAEAALLIRRDDGDIVIHDPFVAAAPNALVIRPGFTHQFVELALNQNADYGIPLARSFPVFRKHFVKRVINHTSRDNALFSLTTALPDVIPSFIELPWSVAEFASDTAFLTMNQLKMAFVLAAASDREVGYREQKSEVAGVVAGAFGWRALARQVVGKIPFGGGLIGKTAIAYAGTKVVGISLNHFYSVGYGYSRQERETLYGEALEQGRRVARDILRHLRPGLAEKLSSQSISKVPMVYPRGDTP